MIAPKQIPYHEIITATEATARGLDKPTADDLRLAVNSVLHQAKFPQPQLVLLTATHHPEPQKR